MQVEQKPRTWCEHAGENNCKYCESGRLTSLCLNNPKAPKGLSYRMSEVLREIGPDWHERPHVATWPTLDALQKRGLIEVRGGRWVAETRRVTAGAAADHEASISTGAAAGKDR